MRITLPQGVTLNSLAALPAGWSRGAADGANYVTLVSSAPSDAIQPGAKLSVGINVTFPSAGSFQFETLVKQSNNFQGTNNDFFRVDSQPTVFVGAQKLGWLTQPSDVEVTTSPSDTWYMCQPVAVQALSSDNQPVHLAGLAVTLSKAKSSRDPFLGGRAAGTITAKTNSAGVATFGVPSDTLMCTSAPTAPGVSAANLGLGYSLTASTVIGSGSSAVSIESVDSDSFSVLPYYRPCGLACTASFSGSGKDTSVVVDGSGNAYNFLRLGIDFDLTHLTCGTTEDNNPYRNLVAVQLDGHRKTVTLTWSKRTVHWSTDNGEPRWPVCFGAPYPFPAVDPATGVISVTKVQTSSGLAIGLLPNCGSPGLDVKTLAWSVETDRQGTRSSPCSFLTSTATHISTDPRTFATLRVTGI